jgi:hypothetical protein
MQLIPIAYFEDRYQISSEGSVLNLANNNFLKPIQNPNGYWKVSLAKGDGSTKQLSLHRLVALHFLPNPYEHPQVNHKNGDKSDNSLVNLEWVSAKGNHEHAFRTNLRPGYMSADDKEKHMWAVLSGTQIKDLAFELGRRPETLHKMLRETAKRLCVHDQWQQVMRENRKNAALKNLKKINT